MKDYGEFIIYRFVKLTILLFSIIIIAFMIIGGCGGGNGNGDKEFTIFDVTIRILEVESQIGDTDCPESANLKLSLLINGNNISGFAELIGFGNVGDASAISGLIENNEFALEPFSIVVTSDVPPDAFFPASSISFDFQQFQGVIIDEDGVLDRMEGEVSGTVFENTGDVIICFDAEFTGEFSGISRSPQGCVSTLEAPTLECPAEGFVNQCNQWYSCYGISEPINGDPIPVDAPPFPASECNVFDCLTVGCPVGTVNLEGLDDYGGFQTGIWSCY